MASKSAPHIINMDADPRVKVGPNTWIGRTMAVIDVIEKDAEDDDGNVLRLCRAHSSWALKLFRFRHDTIVGLTDVNFGAHKADGGALVSANFIADALDFSSAVGEVATAAAAAIAAYNQPLWQRAGLSADPREWWDLSLSIVVSGAAGGTIAFEAEFLVNS